MAIRKIWIGSLGPILFDDTDFDNEGNPIVGIRVDGSVRVSNAPSDPNDVIRKADSPTGVMFGVPVANIDDPSPELASLSLASDGALLVVYQSNASAVDEFTLYAWDDTGVADVPYVVPGDGGYWVAVAGKYVNSKMNVRTTLTIASAPAYTQTYSAASRTHAARTAAALGNGTGVASDTTIEAVSDAASNRNFSDLVDMMNKLRADLENTAQVLNALIDDLQARGLLS